MNIRYRVTLTLEEREALGEMIARGRPQVRRVKRAQILLGADAGQSDEEIAHCVGVGTATVFRTKRRFVELGLEQALAEEPRPGAPRKLTEREELTMANSRRVTWLGTHSRRVGVPGGGQVSIPR